MRIIPLITVSPRCTR